MPSVDTAISGLEVIPLEPYGDARGAVVEIYRRSWIHGAAEAVQANLSLSDANVLRGLHWHRFQRDYWCFIHGRAVVACVDLREGSSTERAVYILEVDTSRGRVGIWIPPGVAHGFEALSAVSLLYLVDTYYTGEDEFGLAWDDRELAIPWPNREPLLSDRDRSNPGLAEVLRDPPRYPLG